MRWIEFAGPVDRPTCGAAPSRRKRKPRERADTDGMAAIGEADPVDAVRRPRCGLVFSAVRHGHDGRHITGRTEFETIPRYRPRCGEDSTGKWPPARKG